MRSIFDNEVKATTRRVVLNAFNRFADPLIAKGEDITAHTLPADMWDFEQSIAAKFVNADVKSQLNLNCYEWNEDVHTRNKHSRSFMLDGNELHNNVNHDYIQGPLRRNLSARKNFFMWADFCGNPDSHSMNTLLHNKNYVTNSMLFVTFACRWRIADSIPTNILNLMNDMRSIYKPKWDSHIATPVIRTYILKNLPKSFRSIVTIPYVATEGQGATPMMLLGFTNAPHVECNELSVRLNYPFDRKETQTRDRDYHEAKKVCLSW